MPAIAKQTMHNVNSFAIRDYPIAIDCLAFSNDFFPPLNGAIRIFKGIFL